MFDPLESIRKWRGKVGLPSSQDIEVEALYMDMKRFEAQGFCDYIMDFFYNKIATGDVVTRSDATVPPDTIESWLRLDDDTKTFVFMYLLGAVYGLMQPPEDGVLAPLRG